LHVSFNNMGWEEGGGVWWQRICLRAWEEELLGECQLLLRDVVLQVRCSDRWIWLLDPAGYTVRGAYTLLSSDGPSLDAVAPEAIWQRHIPLKVSLFVWRLLQYCVPTKDNLFKRRIIYIDDQMCVSGCGQLETAGHLFLDCSFFFLEPFGLMFTVG